MFSHSVFCSSPIMVSNEKLNLKRKIVNSTLKILGWASLQSQLPVRDLKDFFGWVLKTVMFTGLSQCLSIFQRPEFFISICEKKNIERKKRLQYPNKKSKCSLESKWTKSNINLNRKIEIREGRLNISSSKVN